MKHSGISLVASWDGNKVGHPVNDDTFATALAWWTLLADLVPAGAWWTCEVVA